MPAPLGWGLTAAWMLLIWSLSSRTFEQPPEVGAELWRVAANLAHAPLFGILALLVAGIVLRRKAHGAGLPRVEALDALVIAVWVLVWGALDEWRQGSTPGRHPSPFDVVTDLVGALAVLWIVAYLGGSRATESGLRLRLCVGLLACLAASLVVSFAG
jgi:VanZ family protein